MLAFSDHSMFVNNPDTMNNTGHYYFYFWFYKKIMDYLNEKIYLSMILNYNMIQTAFIISLFMQ
jgi:hypothetical protein